MDYTISAYKPQITQKQYGEICNFLYEKGLFQLTYDALHFNSITKNQRITPSIMNAEEFKHNISFIKNPDERYLWQFARNFPISLYYTLNNDITKINILEYIVIKNIYIYGTITPLFDKIQKLEQDIYTKSIKISVNQLKHGIVEVDISRNPNIILLHDVEKILELLEFCEENNIDEVEIKKVSHDAA